MQQAIEDGRGHHLVVGDIVVRPDGRVVPSIEEHLIDLLRRLRFRVTVDTDNRLMSGISLSSEFATLAAHIRHRARRHDASVRAAQAAAELSTA